MKKKRTHQIFHFQTEELQLLDDDKTKVAEEFDEIPLEDLHRELRTGGWKNEDGSFGI